jgi:hypothetical protein
MATPKNKSVFALELTGITDLRGFIKDLNPGSQDRIIMGGMKTAGDTIAKIAKTKIVNNETGALRKSLGTVVKRGTKTGLLMAFVGARSRYYVGGKRLKAGQSYKRSQLRNPAKYSHLVEYGHRSVHGGGALPNYGGKVSGVFNSVNKGKTIRAGTVKATSFVPPRPFLYPAFLQGQNAARSQIMKGFKRALNVEFNRAKRRFDKKKVILT